MMRGWIEDAVGVACLWVLAYAGFFMAGVW